MTVTRLLFLFLMLFAGVLPAYAAELSIQAPLAGAGTPFLMPVTFNAGGNSINVVEGSLPVPDGIAIDSIDTTGSAFSLFAYRPTYDLSSRAIEFTAGAPGGLTPNTVALLFIIHAHASSPGTYVFASGDISGYENDGEGTRVAVSAAPASVVVGAAGSANVDAFPPAPPSALIAEIGKDDSIFDGKWFVTFYGGDSGASVDRYEVREGWWRAPVRADRYYVLQDQDRSSTIWVTAVSENGKTVTTSLPALNPWTEYLVAFALILATGTVVFLIWRRFFRRP